MIVRGGLCFLAAAMLGACGSATDLSIGSQEVDPFRRLWRDEFDAIEGDRWEISTHSFAENYADFTAENAMAREGMLELRVDAKAAGFTGKPYAAAELRSRQEFTYGKFLVRARFASGSGVISTFFAFYDFFQRDPASENWNEIVVESAGTNRLVFTYTLQNVTLPDSRERNSSSIDLAFDSTRDFHVYGFDWTPSRLRFFVDGEVRLTHDEAIAALVRLPKRIEMSAYPSTRTELSGDFDPSALPMVAHYDWVEVYEYTGPVPYMDAGDAGLAE